jgi:hypothetical protein
LQRQPRSPRFAPVANAVMLADAWIVNNIQDRYQDTEIAALEKQLAF